MPYQSWQVAHFRLIKDSIFLPYGASWLNGARRHWRMLSMMEDAMLLYRLERSIERRIFKVNVGLIDDVDVPGFLQEFMNNVKRAPIIDPATGQIDLRKNPTSIMQKVMLFEDMNLQNVMFSNYPQKDLQVKNLPKVRK